ncbi:uncharacterized protein FA14DRAFT_174092 [Meira miltonrushii]|uniref:Uncharacterized protein n=1 Tax=Meira miltonrushii TaxID=1280837 RepID=A0A316VBE3_9BASI|nr:uncharacterized protein FA14DRAFT_174092 [Meira miltonrushii]PWN34418.1 hypothetical protein FA14DRAFT_174092 [Meira miltonrushii]
MQLKSTFAYIILWTMIAAPAMSNHIFLKRSDLTSVPTITPGNGGSNVPSPRIVEGIDLGRGRGTNPFNDRQRHHVHPELPSSHPIRPPDYSSVRYEEEKPGKLERLTGKKRKREGDPEGGAANDHEAEPSDTKEEKPEKVEDQPRKRYRYRHKSGETRKKENEGMGKALAAAGAAVTKKAGDIYRAGQRTVRGIRSGCDAACQRAQRVASRLRNRLTAHQELDKARHTNLDG